MKVIKNAKKDLHCRKKYVIIKNVENNIYWS